MSMDPNDLSNLVVPLPEDIQRAKDFGDFSLTRRLIHQKLNNARISEVLKDRLHTELKVLTVFEAKQYPYEETKALEMMQQSFVDFQREELDRLVEAGEVEWIYLNGKKVFHERFIANLVKTRSDYYTRYLFEEENGIDSARQVELDENVEKMKQLGQRTARIVLKQSLRPLTTLNKEDGPFLTHIPLPRDTGKVANAKILQTKGAVKQIDPFAAPQRTIAFETNDPSSIEATVEHSYELTAVYTDLFQLLDEQTMIRELTESEKNAFASALNEFAPHIQFTPFLQQLLQEILPEAKNPLERAYAIYHFVTTKVTYSFMREYYAIPNISEYCAVNQKGDCGVQALLFITLCRMANIPAEWESGLYVSEFFVGPHDWARFYLPEYGWLYVDVSFGGSAFRGGNEERWRYYFGNLDIFRLPANNCIQGGFTVAKQFLRADPIDNQRGEFESAKKGYRYDELDWQAELIEMTILEKALR